MTAKETRRKQPLGTQALPALTPGPSGHPARQSCVPIAGIRASQEVRLPSQSCRPPLLCEKPDLSELTEVGREWREEQEGIALDPARGGERPQTQHLGGVPPQQICW